MDNLAKNEPLANLRIDFYQDTPSELRQVAEQSVATLIKRREGGRREGSRRGNRSG